MLDLLSKHACFGGEQRFYRHQSAVIGLPMRFSIYLPPQVFENRVDQSGSSNEPQFQGITKLPALFYLAGLTCTEETFVIKAGAQRKASELGLILIAPDTSPRGAGIEGESASWDFGVGAGFYLDATQAPWSAHYRMETYLCEELLNLVLHEFPLAPQHIGIFGHSMGGHGALTLALKHPALFKSVSAFAPICAPTQCPWGEKAFTGYLGEDRNSWLQHDASALMKACAQAPFPAGILIDQGLSDNFLDTQLHPHRFEEACRERGQPLTLRRHAGYDHGYYFISTFMEDHLQFHAAQLRASNTVKS